MGSVGDHPRAADLQDQLFTDLLPLGLECLLELFEAPLAQRPVGGPVGLVECPAGGGDGRLHVAGRAVGDLTEDILGGRVDVVECLARLGIDELPVDKHSRFGLDFSRLGHELLHDPIQGRKGI